MDVPGIGARRHAKGGGGNDGGELHVEGLLVVAGSTGVLTLGRDDVVAGGGDVCFWSRMTPLYIGTQLQVHVSSIPSAILLSKPFPRAHQTISQGPCSPGDNVVSSVTTPSSRKADFMRSSHHPWREPHRQ